MHSKVTYIFLLLFGLILLFKGNTLAVEQKATAAAIELRSRLVQKIDSLDIEKQRLKRSGENFGDIEIQQTLYNDSLLALKQSIQSGLQQPTRQEPAQPSFAISDFVNPQSSLDWVILITSSIAILSFMFMIIAIIKTRRKNNLIKKKAAVQLKRTAIKQAPVVGTGRDQSLPSVLPQIDPLDQIKKKMHEASDYYDKTEPPRPSTKQIRAIANVEKEDIEALVYEEYKKGVDIHEISKAFQISADHVSLLLKIRGITPNKAAKK
jgi:hypothetical protein